MARGQTHGSQLLMLQRCAHVYSVYAMIEAPFVKIWLVFVMHQVIGI